MKALPPDEKAAGTFSAPTAPGLQTRRTDSNGKSAELQAPDQTTLGVEIFRSRNISDIRHQLERKAITCRLIGGSDPMLLPISVQIHDAGVRNAYHMTVITNDKPRLLAMSGEIGDIIRHCHMDGIPPILSTSPTPVWGQDDRDLLETIAFIEELESKALKGGILL